MTVIDPSDCTDLDQADSVYGAYLPQALDVPTAVLIASADATELPAVLQFEVVHRDGMCQKPLADACVMVASLDSAIRFIALPDGQAENGVSFWDRAPAEDSANNWERLSPGQASRGPEVALLGQTLPSQISHTPGAGYLRYRPEAPADGWTVRVGIAHPNGPQHLAEASFEVTVAARPYPTPMTGTFHVTV